MNLFKMIFHLCRNHVKETGVWFSDGLVPCADRFYGSTYIGYDEVQLCECAICGRPIYKEGSPQKVITEYRAGKQVWPEKIVRPVHSPKWATLERQRI